MASSVSLLRVTSSKSIVNSRLTSYLKHLNKARAALELRPTMEVDMDMLSSINPSYCLISWKAKIKKVEYDSEPFELARKLMADGQIVILHMTARQFDMENATNFLNIAKNIGVENILVTSGSFLKPKKEQLDNYEFCYASDLIQFIKGNYFGHFCIIVRGHIDKHADSKNDEEEVKFLKLKIALGANVIITQTSFQYEPYRDFAARCRAANITIPIVPGILIMNSLSTFMLLNKICVIPYNHKLFKFIHKYHKDKEAVEKRGKKMVLELVEHLMADHEFEGPFFYTMNNLDAIKPILKAAKLINKQ